jgi:hypothetical protein
MRTEMQIKLEVSDQAENFYQDAVQLGDHAAFALKARHRSQMTGLENVAESTLKSSDVLDYIKRQTARFPYWRQNFPKDLSNQTTNERSKQSEESDPSNKGFGERLKQYLEEDLVKKRNVICSEKHLNISDKTDEDRQLRRRIYLLLIRQFLRQMVAQYEYRVSFEKKGG